MKNLIRKTDPRAALVGVLMFAFPLLCLTANRAVSSCSFMFILIALWSLRQGIPAWRAHFSQIRWVLLAFGLNFLYVLGSFALRPGEPLGTLEKPLRMLLACAALLCVLAWRPQRRLLWAGVIGGVVSGAVFVGYQRWWLGMERPGGLINAITYGDLALCLGMFALAALIDLREATRPAWRWLALLAALAGVVASLATGSRGGWVAVLAALILFVKYGHVLRVKSIGAICALILGLLVAAYFVPQTGVRARVAVGVTDIQAYAGGGSADTSLGIRLDLWKAATLLIREHPLLGAGIVSHREEVRREVAAGNVNPVILVYPHMHNDSLQVLSTGGLLGWLIWLSTLAAPLLFFLGVLKRHATAANAEVALALAGALLVFSYFSFGLTEVIFWSMRASLFYALLVFIFMGLCLNQTNQANQMNHKNQKDYDGK